MVIDSAARSVPSDDPLPAIPGCLFCTSLAGDTTGSTQRDSPLLGTGSAKAAAAGETCEPARYEISHVTTHQMSAPCTNCRLRGSVVHRDTGPSATAAALVRTTLAATNQTVNARVAFA